MGLRLTGLWQHGDFVKLWSGQTISLIGSAITLLALPLTAAGLPNTTPVQMGLLIMAETLPALLLGLFAGVWVDRYRRRPILIVANIGRGALLLIIPVSAITGVLRIEILYVVAALAGTLDLFFNVAYRSFLPSLLAEEQLVEGNSKLELSRSAMEIAGPGLAGGLIQLVTAPIAIAFDAFSFLISALVLAWIKAPEAGAPPSEEQPNMREEMRTGLRVVFGSKLLRSIAGALATATFFNSILEAVLILYLTRELNITPGLLGVIFTCGSVGFLLGALLQERISRRWGLGLALVGGLFLASLSDLLIPLASGLGARIATMILLILAQFCFGLGLTVFNISQMSLRQSSTPNHLQGRMNATMSFIGMGLLPLGALLGGILGVMIGLRLTLLLAAAGEILACAWVLLPPVWLLTRGDPADALKQQYEPLN